MKCGVPFDVAFSLEPERRLGFVVFYGTLEGGKWNFDAMTWDRRPE